MTRNGSIWMLTAALALSGLATPARAQQVSEARIRELIKQAADPNSRLQVPATVQPGTMQDNRPVVAITLDDAVKFALERNLDIAVQRLNPEINDIAYASIKSVYHPTLTSLLSTQSTTNASTSTISGANAGAAVIVGVTNYNGGIAQSIPWGGGSASVQLNNTKNTTTSLNTLFNPTWQPNWSGTYIQPLFRNFRIDSTRRSAAGDQDQPRHLGRAAAGDDHQHAVERPQRLLGLRLRRAGGRGRAAVARPGEQAGAGQPDARRGRHDGADRRRPGAVRAGDAPPDAGRRAGNQAHHRAGAEAADRRRHAGSELERPARSDRPAGLPRRADRHRGGGPPRAQRAHRPRDRQEEHRRQRRHAEIPRRSDAAAGRPVDHLRPGRARRHAARQGSGTRRQRRRERHHSRAATATRSRRCSATTTRAGRCS